MVDIYLFSISILGRRELIQALFYFLLGITDVFGGLWPLLCSIDRKYSYIRHNIFCIPTGVLLQRA